MPGKDASGKSEIIYDVRCPDCRKKMRVTSTRKKLRWFRCPACGRRKKEPRRWFKELNGRPGHRV